MNLQNKHLFIKLLILFFLPLNLHPCVETRIKTCKNDFRSGIAVHIDNSRHATLSPEINIHKNSFTTNFNPFQQRFFEQSIDRESILEEKTAQDIKAADFFQANLKTNISGLIDELQKQGARIDFSENISDFSLRKGNIIYLNSDLFKMNRFSPLYKTSLKTLQVIVESQLRKHLYTKPAYGGKLEQFVSEVCASSAEMHTLSSLSNLVITSFIKLRTDSPAIKDKLSHLKSMKSGRDLDRGYYTESLENVKKDSITPTGIESALEFHLNNSPNASDRAYLNHIVGCALTMQEDKPFRLSVEKTANASDLPIKEFWEFSNKIISQISLGRQSPEYKNALQTLIDMNNPENHMHRGENRNAQIKIYSTIRMMGFILEIEENSPHIRDFLEDYFASHKKNVLDKVIPFCEQIVDSVDNEDADAFFMYRGSWTLKEISEKIAQARGMDTRKRINGLYFSRNILTSTPGKNQIDYLADSGVLENRKILLIDSGFRGTIIRHIARIVTDDYVENVGRISDHLPDFSPFNPENVKLFLLGFLQGSGDDISVKWKNKFDYSYKFGNDSDYINLVYFLEEALEDNFNSSSAIEKKALGYTPVLEKTWFPQLRDISKKWLNEVIDEYININYTSAISSTDVQTRMMNEKTDLLNHSI